MREHIKGPGEAGVVSVIVPAYNREQYIARTLEGVWDQTYRPIELIVVDDGSTDATASIVREWIENHSGDSRFSARLIQQENRGVAAARNAGFQASSGEFIHFLDSDDVPLPVMYELQTDALVCDPACGYVWSGWQDATDDDVEDAVEYVMSTDADPSLGRRVCTMPYLVWPGLFRRGACLSIGNWNESLYYNEDWEYSSRFLCLEPVIRQLPNTMMIYRNHKGGERVTARAIQHKANEAKLQTISTIKTLIPESLGFRRVLVKRLAMMCYSALLHACREGYKNQQRASRRTCVELLRDHRALLAMRWKFKLSLLSVMASFGGASLVRTTHSIAGRIKRSLGVSTSQWFN